MTDIDLDELREALAAGEPTCRKCGHKRSEHHFRHPFEPSHEDKLTRFAPTLATAYLAKCEEVKGLREAASVAAGYIEGVIEDGCQRCGGDCSSAMPPVAFCPIREAARDLAALRAAIREDKTDE